MTTVEPPSVSLQKDETNFASVLTAILEIPSVTVRSKHSTEGTLTLEVEYDLGSSVVVATSNSTFESVINRPTIIVAWNIPNPLAFVMTPNQNMTYFDLRFGITSLKLPDLAVRLRERLEAKGYRFTRFDTPPPKKKPFVVRVLRYGKRLLISKVIAK
jgi:hypothetical protein